MFPIHSMYPVTQHILEFKCIFHKSGMGVRSRPSLAGVKLNFVR